MRLTLTYRGPLPPKKKGVSPVKAALRQSFHPQVKAQVSRLLDATNQPLLTSKVGDHEFVSPAHGRFRTAFELDVLLLTGAGVKPGDPDNRLKTLIDGLTRPANQQQLAHFEEPPEGGPTFCLPDDDNLVERVSVDTRRWYEPGLAPNEAFVVVTANLVLAQDATLDTPINTLFFLVS